MSFPARVRIVEVGPRDGLQNEKEVVGVEAKLALIEALTDAGCRDIEVGSFVSPKWVPQMASTGELLERLARRAGVNYTVLAPNLQGFARAQAAAVTEVAVFAAASETFSRKNINCSIAESLDRFRPVMEQALSSGIRVRGYISCALGCPYEGEIPHANVVRVASDLRRMGCYEISLGDTIGVGTPLKARAMIDAVLDVAPAEKLALHFHDTYGQALANILACLERGVSVVDAAVGGLGGCPYAKGATGNVATEDVVYMLNGMGIKTGIDLGKLISAGAGIAEVLGRPTTSRVARAMSCLA